MDDDISAPLVSCDLAPDESPSEGVVRALAAVTGADPVRGLEPLYSVLDPDALDAVFADGHGAGDGARVSFVYGDYRVTVHGTERVAVRTGEEVVGGVVD